jgi:hypothetical protein
MSNGAIRMLMHFLLLSAINSNLTGHFDVALETRFDHGRLAYRSAKSRRARRWVVAWRYATFCFSTV